MFNVVYCNFAYKVPANVIRNREYSKETRGKNIIGTVSSDTTNIASYISQFVLVAHIYDCKSITE